MEAIINFLKNLFATLDGYVASFMGNIFESINGFWTKIYAGANQGAYICSLLVALFLAILLLIGLIKVIKKFGFFIFIVLITIGIPCLWYFLVLGK